MASIPPTENRIIHWISFGWKSARAMEMTRQIPIVHRDITFTDSPETFGLNSLRTLRAMLEVMIIAIAATVVWIPATIPASTIPPKAGGRTFMASHGFISSGTARPGFIALPMIPEMGSMIAHMTKITDPIQIPRFRALVFLKVKAPSMAWGTPMIKKPSMQAIEKVKK